LSVYADYVKHVHRAVPDRRCSACIHIERSTIDRFIAIGARSIQAISDQFGLTKPPRAALVNRDGRHIAIVVLSDDPTSLDMELQVELGNTLITSDAVEIVELDDVSVARLWAGFRVDSDMPQVVSQLVLAEDDVSA
jgi:hypothetical protein